MLDAVDVVVGRDPALQLFPAQHFAGRLLIQERDESLAFFRIVEAEAAQWIFRERQRGQSNAAFDHLAPGDRRWRTPFPLTPTLSPGERESILTAANFQ